MNTPIHPSNNVVPLAKVGQPLAYDAPLRDRMFLITGKENVITVTELNAILAPHGYTIMPGVAHNNYSLKQLPRWLAKTAG